MTKIGLFFGSFNPIHIGHLILAQTALNLTDLDKVWFVVSPQNPFKEKKNLLPEYDRMRMADLVLDGNHDILPSNVEFSLPKPSYTIDTLTHLSERYKSYEFSLIMGEDNLQHFHKWKNHEAILKYYRIFVYPRVDCEPSELANHPNVHKFEAPLLNISATYIRETVKSGGSVRYMVPEEAYAYIEQNALFR
ncbi:MAG: nicotinate (nicotinamide) nucleotide adenylyltransferase [Bacteroidia bacterium]|nr:nicotinate (nicotinamide) nucleotide adenylyltransferase [Bacteroidia bacterium]